MFLLYGSDMSARSCSVRSGGWRLVGGRRLLFPPDFVLTSTALADIAVLTSPNYVLNSLRVSD